MPFTYDSRGVKPSQFSDPVPDGTYTLEIMKADEQQSRNGSPMVKVTCAIEDKDYSGATVYHYVTFLEKGTPGAGISTHFLKCIGEPFEEDESLEVTPKNWVAKKFKARVIQDKFKRQDGTEGISNKIKTVMPTDADVPF
jgi:hypothetical protein